MKSSSRFHVLAGALAIGTVTTIVAPASATTDTTKPALSMAKYAQFVIGSQINSFPEGDGATESEVTVRFTWKATDASAICDTFLWQEYGSGEDGLASYSDPTLHSWSDLVNSNNDVGKGWQLRGWWVEVRDCAGNETDRWVQGGMPSFTQDSGQVSDIYDGTTISYSVNNWAVSNCTCCRTEQRTRPPQLAPQRRSPSRWTTPASV